VINPTAMLAALPAGLRTPLIECFQEIVRNYIERRWEPAELNGGKFCEIVYTILDGALAGTYAASPSKPANMVVACRALEGRPANPARVGDRSLRILIPRLLPVLYEIRSNRNVGHVGGEVNPNHADAEAVLSMTSWVMAELVRIFHNVTLVEAQEAVESLVERRHPLVWEVEGKKRVLDNTLSKSDQALILLHSVLGWVNVSTLQGWVEYANTTQYKDRILKALHRDRLVEFDTANNRVRIAPPGIRRVEDDLLKSRT
jgi:hypothetical protein